MSIEMYVKALTSADPQQRRQAIVALGKSGDQRALKPLADTYKNDSDPQLRELALKAGRHLRKELSASEPEPASQSNSSAGGFMFISDTPGNISPITSLEPAQETTKDDVPDWMHQMGGDRPAPKPVSDRDRARAASYVDRAMDASIRKENKKTIELLEKALEINPALEKDSRTLGLLAMAFETSSDQAVAALRTRKGAKKKGDASAEKGEWSEVSDFFVEMGIWLLLLGLLLTGATYWIITNTNWDEYKAEAEAQGATDEEIELIDALKNYGPQQALYIGFGYAAGLVVVTTILSTYIWIVGTFMGGSGILFKFITSTFRGMAIILLVTTLTSVLARFAAPGSNDASILGFAPFVFGMLYTGYAVGNAHEFGMTKGCLNLVASVSACPFVCCLLLFIMGL